MAYETTNELALYVENELGHNLGGAASAQRDDIISHLDRAQKVVLQGGGILNFSESSRGSRRKRDEVEFLWARASSPKLITLEAPYESGFTVAVNNGSTSVTLSADPTSGGDLADWYFRIGNDEEVYRVASHTGTSITLDSAYVRDDVTAATGKLFKLDYAVGSSDILKPIGPIRIYGKNKNSNVISLTDRDELLDSWPLFNVDKFFPQSAAVKLYLDGTITLQFNSYADAAKRLELDYIALPTALDTTTPVNPILPKQHRICLAHLAAYYMLQRNDDDRASSHLNMARDLFDELVDYNRMMLSSGDSNYGRVVPDLGSNNPKLVRVKTDYDNS